MSYFPPNIVVLMQKATPISLTGTIVQTTLDSLTISGGYMGISGWLQIEVMWSNNNSGNNKTLTVSAGATNISAVVNTTSIGNNKRLLWANQGVANSQRFFLASNAAGMGNSNTTASSAIDTSVDFTLAFKGTLANSGDTITLEAYSVVLIRNLYP